MAGGIHRMLRRALLLLGMLTAGFAPVSRAAGSEYRVPLSPPPGSVRLDSLEHISWVAFGTPPCATCPVRACADAPVEFDLFGGFDAHYSPRVHRLELAPDGVPLQVVEFELMTGGAPDVIYPFLAGLELPATTAGPHFVDIETRTTFSGRQPPPPIVHRQRVRYDVLPDCRVVLGPVAPNPFSARTGFAINLFRESDMEVSVHDLAGRRIATLARGRFGPGEAFFEWDGAGAADGVYLVRFNVDGRLHSTRVTLLRGGR